MNKDLKFEINKFKENRDAYNITFDNSDEYNQYIAQIRSAIEHINNLISGEKNDALVKLFNEEKRVYEDYLNFVQNTSNIGEGGREEITEEQTTERPTELKTFSEILEEHGIKTDETSEPEIPETAESQQEQQQEQEQPQKPKETKIKPITGIYSQINGAVEIVGTEDKVNDNFPKEQADLIITIIYSIEEAINQLLQKEKENNEDLKKKVDDLSERVRKLEEWKKSAQELLNKLESKLSELESKQVKVITKEKEEEAKAQAEAEVKAETEKKLKKVRIIKEKKEKKKKIKTKTSTKKPQKPTTTTNKRTIKKKKSSKKDLISKLWKLSGLG